MATIRERTPAIVPAIVAISDGLLSESPLPDVFKELVLVEEEPNKPSVVPVLDRTPCKDVVKVPCPTLPVVDVAALTTGPTAIVVVDVGRLGVTSSASASQVSISAGKTPGIYAA